MKCLFFGAPLVAAALLSGCGAVNSLIPEIDNLVALDGTSADAISGSGRAVISGHVARTVTFSDRDLPEKNRLRRLKLRQGLSPDVALTMPAGTSAPASFALRNITLKIVLSDGGESRTASASGTLAGPVTFTRQGSSNTYSASGPLEVAGLSFASSGFATARDIITSAPSPNTVEGRLSFDADDSQLPAGTVLRFTFRNGKARVEL